MRLKSSKIVHESAYKVKVICPKLNRSHRIQAIQLRTKHELECYMYCEKARDDPPFFIHTDMNARCNYCRGPRILLTMHVVRRTGLPECIVLDPGAVPCHPSACGQADFLIVRDVMDVRLPIIRGKAMTRISRYVTGAVCCVLFLGLSAGSCRACTCFGFTTPAGAIYGANLDYFDPGDGFVFINQRGIAKEGFPRGTTGAIAKWVSEYGSVTFNMAGRELAFGGMNDAGLVVGMAELAVSTYPEPDERPALTMGGWVQYILDTCGSVEEVLQVAAKVRIEDHGPANHYLILDAEGNCASMEWFDGQLECRTGESLPVKVMSNMPYGRALASLERGGPRFWWSNPGQSAERFAGAHARCADYDPSRDTDAIQYAFDTLTRVAVPWTKWSLVYDIPKRQVWYRSVESPTIKHLSLEAFDLSCEGALLMLDMNAAVEGDVRNYFTPYDRDANVRLLRTLCARRGNELSEQEAEELMDHFDTFTCDHKGVREKKPDGE